MNGAPGARYWQNKAVYAIHIEAAPPNRTISGTEEITYTNNSPDTLKFLNFKLFMNTHKAGAARLGTTREAGLTSGVHIDRYSENGTPIDWEDQHDGTNKRIKLAKALAPKEQIKLAIDWHYDLSTEEGREGVIDSTTFFLAYFYPRIAVYDDYRGWDMMTFTGSQEFYSDFNDYTLDVAVPKNYVVWATGEFLNPKEVLQKKYVTLLEESEKSDQIIRIATPDDLAAKQITQQHEQNIWKWKAEAIPDVALAISDHYNWDAGSVIVDTVSKRRVSVQAAYDDQSADFHQMVDFGKHALHWFSTQYPGVAYPYPKSTIVRGFADMEYPMMVNDNSTEDPDFSRFVVEHEIAHTYFPFYMGTNETRFGFMDEGWATTLEHLISIDDLGEQQAVENFKMFRVNRWINDANMEQDLPIITPSNILSGPALGNNEYGKAALGYLALKDLLGAELFKKTLLGYMDRWHGKHPTPWDFFFSFNDISRKNLNWFWNNWFFSNHYIDLKIKEAKQENGQVQLDVENIGGFVNPFTIVLTFKDGSTQRIHQTPAVWQSNQREVSLKLEASKALKSVQIEGGIFMDANLEDNSFML